jgi:hypothetical protein
VRTDPADTGGLFIGRRPGTGPVHYRDSPQFRGQARQQVDGALAALLLVLMGLGSLLCWGPMPLVCLWIGSKVAYLSGGLFLGICVAFIALFPMLFGTLLVMGMLDRAWILLRRAAGHDQRVGAFTRIFAVAAVIGLIGFSLWLWVLHGPGSEFQSPGSPITTW